MAEFNSWRDPPQVDQGIFRNGPLPLLLFLPPENTTAA